MPAPAGYWKFNVSDISGVEENLPSAFAQPAYPNPSRGITCIPVETAAPVQGRLVLRDMLGRQIQVIGQGEFYGRKNHFINTENLAAGVYLIELQTGKQVFRQKLMVK